MEVSAATTVEHTIGRPRSVEQVAQPRATSALVTVVAMTVLPVAMSVVAVPMKAAAVRGGRPVLVVPSAARVGCRIGTLDEFLELSAVEPDPPTSRAEIDFDSLAVSELKVDRGTSRTAHGMTPSVPGDGVSTRAVDRPLRSSAVRCATGATEAYST